MATCKLPSQACLRQRLSYNPETGVLIWLERPLDDFSDFRTCKAWNSRNAGRPALAVRRPHGYLSGTLNGASCYAHRIIWKLVHNEEPPVIDHINGDGWDNRLCNLRASSHRDNLKNMKLDRRNRSGFAGICKAHNRWQVQIGARVVGSFSTLRKAVVVRRRLERRLGYSEGHGKMRETRR